MKSRNLFLLMILLVISIKSFSQVTVAIQNVLLNNQTNINNCGTIDFGTVSTNSLNFSFKLSKNVSFTSNGIIKIMLKYSSSSYGSMRASQDFQSTSWSIDGTTSEGYISTNISASEIQVNGSSIYLEYSANGNDYKSCEYPLTKTPLPTFSLSPTSISLDCGDTANKTFTVTPANIPSGATVTYSWSHNGWVFVSSTATSRTLKQNANGTLPSNVTVTPYINGVAQASKTCVVSRASFTTNATINGNAICSGSSVFSINDLPLNTTVSWSSLNTNIATVVSQSNNQATVSAIASSGNFNLQAIITNACGQTKTIVKTIQIGAPQPHYVAERDDACSFSFRAFDFAGATTTNSTHVWEFLNGTGSASYQNFYTNGAYASLYACPPFLVNLKLTTTTGCGSTTIYVWLELNEGEEINKSVSNKKPTDITNLTQTLDIETIIIPVGFSYKVYPNPSKDTIYVELQNSVASVSNIETPIVAALYDVYGKVVLKPSIYNKTAIDISSLAAGIYFLKFNLKEKLIHHKIIKN